MSEPLVISEVGDGIIRCALSRPKKRNALNAELVEKLLELTEVVELRQELVCVMLTAGDSPDFCAGGDLGFLSGLSSSEALAFSDKVYRLCVRIESSPALWCAMLRGKTIGGGAELALACDRRFVTECSTLSFSQLKMGLPSGWGGFARLSRQVGHATAVGMILEAQVLDTQTQIQYGMSESILGDDVKTMQEWMSRWCTRDAAVLRSAMKTLKGDGERAIERTMFAQSWGQTAHREALESFLTRRRR